VLNRGEWRDAGDWLQRVYQEELLRPEGLWIDGGPDWEGIAAWLLDAYQGLRDSGRSPDQAKATILASIRASDEWRQKHGSGPSPSGPEVPRPSHRDGARAGVVHAEGRSWVDDHGSFYPLGATLFWALRGWKVERDRLRANLAFLQAHTWDYIRILGEVGWRGNEIDPRWSDYETLLGELIDCAYDEYGLRVEITCLGSGTSVPAVDVATKIASVVRRRPEKVLDLEAANEAVRNQIAEPTVISVVKALRMALPASLIACTSPSGGADEAKRCAALGGANLLTVHLDRAPGDGGWRAVRQPWDWRDVPYPISHNEPIGPRSSVAETTDPWILTMLRAVGIGCGLGAFVLHNGAGVAGQVDPNHDRPANLWEVPGIQRVMDVLRGLDAILPPDLPNWPEHTTQHGATPVGRQPVVADAIWPDGADHGVTRCYGVCRGNAFLSLLLGVRQFVVLTTPDACDLDVLHPLTGAIVHQHHGMPAGGRVLLDGPERNGAAAYLIRGRR